MIKPSLLTVTWQGGPQGFTLGGNYPNRQVGLDGYSYTPIRAGGVGPFTYSVQSGSIPTGLSLNTSTGEITGKPTATGTYTFTIRCTDSTMATADLADTIDIVGDTHWADVLLLGSGAKRNPSSDSHYSDLLLLIDKVK